MQRTQFLSAAVAAAGACAVPAIASAQRGATPVTVGALSAPDMATLYYALEQKLFAPAGLDVTVQPMPNGAAAMGAVVGGSLQIAVANILSLAQAHQRGIGVRLLAPSGSYNTNAPAAKLLVAADSPIRTVKDLEGTSIAVVSLHDLMAVAIEGWLDANGVDRSRIRFIEIPPTAMSAALEAKRVDAMAVYEPFLSAAEAAGARSLGKPYDAIAPNFTVTAWFTLESWGEKNREAALRFAAVMNRTSPYVNAHYDELIPLISRFSKLPPETLQRMARPIIAKSLAAAPIQPVIDAAAKYHEIERVFPAGDLIFPGAA